MNEEQLISFLAILENAAQRRPSPAHNNSAYCSHEMNTKLALVSFAKSALPTMNKVLQPEVRYAIVAFVDNLASFEWAAKEHGVDYGKSVKQTHAVIKRARRR